MFAYCNNDPVNNSDYNGAYVYGYGISGEAAFGGGGSTGIMQIMDDKGNFAIIITGFYGGGTPAASVSWDVLLVSDAPDIFEFVYGFSGVAGGSAWFIGYETIMGTDSDGNEFGGHIFSASIGTNPELHAGLCYACFEELQVYHGETIPKSVPFDFFSDLKPCIQDKLKEQLLILSYPSVTDLS